jgi:hypothetical protein
VQTLVAGERGPGCKGLWPFLSELYSCVAYSRFMEMEMTSKLSFHLVPFAPFCCSPSPPASALPTCAKVRRV